MKSRYLNESAKNCCAAGLASIEITHQVKKCKKAFQRSTEREAPAVTAVSNALGLGQAEQFCETNLTPKKL